MAADPTMAADGADAVAAALQHYADRGVFRGFSVTQERGRRLFRFVWLSHQIMTLSYDPRTAVLSFAQLFPGVDPRSTLLRELKIIVADRATPAVPAHKRIDRRRVRLSFTVRHGAASLTLGVRGKHHAYAVQRALNLVNDLFLALHASYPDYLIDQFGFSSE